MPGSGKHEVADVAEEEGVPVVTMGDVVRAECRERGLDPTDHHGQVAQSLRDENGPTAIAEASLPYVEEALEESDTVLVDGLRSPDEVDLFREEFDEAFSVLAVEASFDTRADRLAERGRDASDEDRAELREREERELGWGTGEVIEDADRTIKNEDRSLEEFHAAVGRVFREARVTGGSERGDERTDGGRVR